MKTNHTLLAAEYEREARERSGKATEHRLAGRRELADAQDRLAEGCMDLAHSHLRLAQLEKEQP